MRDHRDTLDWSFPAMGTTCRVLIDVPARAVAEAFRKSVLAWVADFERRYSFYRDDSLVSEINRQAGKDWVAIDSELASLFALCDRFHWVTGGVFDPTSAPLARLWDYHRPHAHPPTEAQVRSALALTGWRKVQRADGRVFLPEQGMAIDMGGIGKEYAVDRVFEMAAKVGIQHVMVDFGHDVRVAGVPADGGAWRIGLEDPGDPGRCWGGVAVTDRAVATSGDYQRHVVIDGVRCGHIVDPRSGQPAQNACRAATVVAPTCTEAGVLATAACVLGLEEGLALLRRCYHVEGCMVTDSHVHETSGFRRYLIEGGTR